MSKPRERDVIKTLATGIPAMNGRQDHAHVQGQHRAVHLANPDIQGSGVGRRRARDDCPLDSALDNHSSPLGGMMRKNEAATALPTGALSGQGLRHAHATRMFRPSSLSSSSRADDLPGPSVPVSDHRVPRGACPTTCTTTSKTLEPNLMQLHELISNMAEADLRYLAARCMGARAPSRTGLLRTEIEERIRQPDYVERQSLPAVHRRWRPSRTASSGRSSTRCRRARGTQLGNGFGIPAPLLRCRPLPCDLKFFRLRPLKPRRDVLDFALGFQRSRPSRVRCCRPATMGRRNRVDASFIFSRLPVSGEAVYRILPAQLQSRRSASALRFLRVRSRPPASHEFFARLRSSK